MTQGVCCSGMSKENIWAAAQENRFSGFPGFPTRFDISRSVQAKKMARSLKLRI